VKLYVGGRPTFFTFFYVFSDFKKHDFFVFFELLHTFSRTLVTESSIGYAYFQQKSGASCFNDPG